jgi:hypothetical protein
MSFEEIDTEEGFRIFVNKTFAIGETLIGEVPVTRPSKT